MLVFDMYNGPLLTLYGSKKEGERVGDREERRERIAVCFALKIKRGVGLTAVIFSEIGLSSACQRLSAKSREVQTISRASRGFYIRCGK